MTEPISGKGRRRRRWLWPAITVAGVAVAGTFLTAGLAARANHAGEQAASASPDYGSAPTYRFIDQNRHHVSSGEFLGKVQVVSFLFPYCHSYCPLIARTMAELADTVAAGPLRTHVQLLSFNLDPAGADPQVLHRYIAQYGADPDSPTWRYLTGAPNQIRQAVTGGFHIFYNKVSLRYERRQAQAQQRQALRQAATHAHPQTYTPPPYEANPLATKAHVAYDVTHDDYVEIVNARGQIVAVFDQASALTTAQLLDAIRDAMTGKPIPPQPVR